MRSTKGRSILPERLDSLKLFQKEIGVWFSNTTMLNTALTHSSHSEPSNERLEFLGDSVISLVVGEYLFKAKPHALEGEMTSLRSDLVREETLAEVARTISLGDYILLGEGEARSGGRDKSSILSNAYEALVAAIYLEEGLEEARDFVQRTLVEREKSIPKKRNYKSLLQEALARKASPVPTYRVVYEEGPDHKKMFTVEALVDNTVVGRATGSTKKTAEQRAARSALKSLKLEKGSAQEVNE